MNRNPARLPAIILLFLIQAVYADFTFTHIRSIKPSGVDSFSGLTASALGPDGGLAVGDRDRILFFDKDGDYVRTLAAREFGSDRLTAEGMIYGPDGVLYLGDAAGGRILRVDFRRKLLTDFVQRSRDKFRRNLTLSRPGGLTLNRSGELFAVDASGRIVVFSSDGGAQAEISSYFSTNLFLNRPSGITAGRGKVYLCDTGNDLVSILDAFDNRVEGLIRIPSPMGIAFVSIRKKKVRQDCLAVSSEGRIRLFSPEGRAWGEIGHEFVSPGHLSYMPHHYDPSRGFLAVTDTGSSTVELFGVSDDD